MRSEIDIDAAPAHQLHRVVEHGQRLEAEKVELHQAGLLDPFHVELGHRHVGSRIAIERHQFGQRPVADHDAGRMGRGVAVQAFELLRDLEGAPRRSARDRARPAAAARRRWRVSSVTGAGRVLRHQLAELSTWP